MATTEAPLSAEATAPAAPAATAPTAPTAPGPVPANGVPRLPRGTTLLGAMLVMAADAMLLAGLLAAWFLVKGGSPAWPPAGASIDTYMATTYTITAVMSSFSVAWAVSASKRNDQRTAGVAVVLTVILGVAQINVLWYALANAGFGVADHAFGTLYFLLIGYVLVHMAVGLVAVFVAGGRAVAGQVGARHHDPVRAAGVLWHYSTLAWSLIVIAVFVFSPHG